MSDTKKTRNLADTQFYTCLYELNQELKAEDAIFRLVHNFCFDRVEVVPTNATHLEYGKVVLKLSDGYRSYLSGYFAKHGCTLQFDAKENCFQIVSADNK